MTARFPPYLTYIYAQTRMYSKQLKTIAKCIHMQKQGFPTNNNSYVVFRLKWLIFVLNLLENIFYFSSKLSNLHLINKTTFMLNQFFLV
jgi:hypothetical protein